MTTHTITKDEHNLHALELRIGELIQLVEQLQEENRQLKQQRAQWMREREKLMERYLQAREKIKGVLQRIDTLEQMSD